jgi:RNA polymerase sigma-70 factor, ECF subfamily
LPSFEKKFRPEDQPPDSLLRGADDTVQPSAEPPLDGDRKLMRLVAEGDSVAQRTVVTRLMGRVKGVCHALIHDTADADDTAQVSLLQVLRAASTYRGDGALESWADRIAIRNAMRAVSSRRKNVARTADEVELDEVAAPALDSDTTESSPRAVEAYLRKLPETARTVLTLRHQLGYSVREIAELTEVSPNTVKDRLLRGREQLRKLIRRDRAIGAKAWDVIDATSSDQARVGDHDE